MRIAYLSTAQFPSTTAHSLQVMKMCEAMIEEGHSVTLFAPRPRQGPGPDDSGLTSFYGVGAVPRSVFIKTPRMGGRRGLAVRIVWKALGDRFDLVYTRGVDLAFFAAFRGCPSVLELHQMPPGHLGPCYFRGYLRQATPKRLVAISSRLQEMLRVRYPSRAALAIQVAPDAVDPREYERLPSPPEARRRLGRAPEQFTVGYLGSLYPGRGMELVLELAQRMPDLRFQVGGGDEGQLEQYRLGDTPPNIDWLRHVPHAEVPLQQAACEVLLMPYQRKVTVQGKGDTADIMSPLKLFEYMAAGRLIVASDLPALREILNERNSVLVPPDSLSEWQQAIRRAQTDVTWREALAAQARVDVSPFTWQNRVRAILAPDRSLDHE
jgi:glycosyltransferase involved in cell wall biosynthesis